MGKEQITLPEFGEGEAVVIMKDEGEIFATKGDYGHRTRLDVRKTVKWHEQDQFFDRDNGDTVELLGDFNGWAVYRPIRPDEGEIGRVFMVTWDRFEDEFERL